MSETASPTLPAPKVCGRCEYFRQIPQNQFGNCHGNPPSVERAPTGQVFTSRPQVLPADHGCILFADK